MRIRINPYAPQLSDAQREYQLVLFKRVWYPEDVKRLEELNTKIGRLKLLVSLWEQGQYARN